MLRPAIIALSIGATAGAAHAFDINDCIINGMKGVSSDLAARQVRYACDQKLKAYKQERWEAMAKEFGEPVDLSALDQAATFNFEEPGFHSILFTSTLSDRNVSYVRLEVAPAPDGPGTSCDMSKLRIHAYRVTIKPRASLRLIYPTSATANCVTPKVVLAKAPSWSDVALRSWAKPVDKDPFAGMD